MKKLLICLTMSLIVLMSSTVFAKDITVTIDGKNVIFPDAKPFIDVQSERTLVPIRFVAESLGAKVDWYDKTRQAVITLDNTIIALTIDSNRVNINNNGFNIDVAPKIINERTFVPLRFVAESLNSYVDWEDQTYTVVIRKKTVKNIWSYKNKDIPQELYTYELNKDTLSQRNFSNMNNLELVRDYGITYCEQMMFLGKNYIELDTNLNYNTIGNDFRDKYRYYFNPGTEWDLRGQTLSAEKYIDEYINIIKQFTVVSKGQFVTDPSLVYFDRDGNTRIRGRLIIKYNDPTKADLFSYIGFPGLEIGKTYYTDIEICVANISRENKSWDYADEQFLKTVTLKDFTLVE